MSTQLPPWVGEVLSAPRFRGYLAAGDGDVAAAIALYRWNVEVSAAFVIPLHWVEVAVRNAMHARLIGHTGRVDWWAAGVALDDNGLRRVADARGTLRRLGKDADVVDSVVAELSFGFWVSLLSSRYHRTIWVPALSRVFPGRSRRDVHEDYRHVLVLRNRIMHGEPIHGRHLEADYETLCRLLGRLSPDALMEVTRNEQVREVLTRRGKV